MNIKPAEVKEQVKAFLSHELAGKWFLIFDNADDMEMWPREARLRRHLRTFSPRVKIVICCLLRITES